MRRRAGFTLLEVMVSLAVIATLASVAATSLIVEVRRRQQDELNTEMKAIARGLARYLQDMGAGPPAGQLADALQNRGPRPAATVGPAGVFTGWNGPYVRAAVVGMGMEDPFLDPWGAPYEHTVIGASPTWTWSLRSRGRDAQLGTADDVVTSSTWAGFLSVEVWAADAGSVPERLGPPDVTVELFRPVAGTVQAVSTASPQSASTWSWDSRGQFFFSQAATHGPHAVRITGKPSTPYAGRGTVVVAYLEGNGSVSRVTLP